MDYIKRNELLRVYENNLSRSDKSEISQKLGYAQAGGLKSYLKRLPNSFLNLEDTTIVNNFFAVRGGFKEQLVMANKKLEKHDLENKETKDLIDIIVSIIPRIQEINDTSYLNKVKESLEVAISTVDTQFKINKLY